MPDIMGDWPAFAFSRESQWGVVLLAFLRAAYERSGSLHTLVHYRQMLTDFFTTPPARLPDAYSRDDVERFIHSPGRAAGREGKPPGPGTMNNRLSCVKSFYSYAAGYTIAGEQGVIQPVLRVPAPTLGFHQVRYGRTRRVLGASEVERFLAGIPTDTERGLKYRALYLTYLFTARRASEILALRYEDIERVTLVEHGQSRETYSYAFYGKGHKRERDTAELPQPSADAIFRYLAFSGRLATIQPTDAVFTADTTYHGHYGYDPKRPMREQTIWQAAKGYARAAGIDEALVTIHAFRHVSARERYAAGSDIREIQQLLRHRSLATTDLYLSTMIGTSDPGAKLLEQRFGKL